MAARAAGSISSESLLTSGQTRNWRKGRDFRGSFASSFPCMIQSGTPGHGVLLPTFRVSRPSSGLSLLRQPHKQAQNCVSSMTSGILNSTKQTTELSHRTLGDTRNILAICMALKSEICSLLLMHNFFRLEQRCPRKYQLVSNTSQGSLLRRHKVYLKIGRKQCRKSAERRAEPTSQVPWPVLILMPCLGHARHV